MLNIDYEIKPKLVKTLSLVLFMLFSCKGGTSYKISDYTKKIESFYVNYGKLQYDTLPNNLESHKVIEGNSIVVAYKREGTTFIDANDYEAKYYEYLIFELDTNKGKFEICDTSLSKVNCKYYWICLSKELKKEIRDVDKGCVYWQYYGDSLMLNLDVEVDFSFGGFIEKKKNRSFKQKKLIAL